MVFHSPVVVNHALIKCFIDQQALDYEIAFLPTIKWKVFYAKNNRMPHSLNKINTFKINKVAAAAAIHMFCNNLSRETLKWFQFLILNCIAQLKKY